MPSYVVESITGAPVRGLLIAGLSLCAAPAAVQAATSPSITVNSLTASPATVAPGQTVTFSAVLTANETVSTYPIEFAWGGAGANNRSDPDGSVIFANYKAGAGLTETASWTVPAGTAPGTYTIGVGAYSPGFSTLLANKMATYTVAAPTQALPPAAPSVTVNSLTASPATVAPGQTITFSAALTANQSLSNYPVEFAWGGAGANNTNDPDSSVVYANYKAGASVNETASWTVPAGTAPGTYTIGVDAYTPGLSTLLANKTATYTVVASTTAAPFAITVNSVTASPPAVQPGQSVNFAATLTANQSVSGYPVKISWTPPGSSTATAVTNSETYQANQPVTTTANWSVPAGTPAGTYTVNVAAYTPAFNAPVASTSATFSVSAGETGTASKPGPSAALFAAPFYSCVRNFYVATTGSDASAGTQASPWQTIQHADSSARQAGDCINVAPGTYSQNVVIQHGGNAPTPTGYVAYRCETLDGCHVVATNSAFVWGVENPGNFVVVDGFDVDGNSALQAGGVAAACLATGFQAYGTGNEAHHLWFLNNLVHDCNTSGISTGGGEWFYFMHNSVYNNSFSSAYQGSGISLVVAQCIEAGNASCASGNTFAGGTGTYTPSGMDLTYAAPFHMVISDNNVYNNMIASYNSVGCGSHTDGNGIIMDTFFDGGTGTITYPFQSLVAGNVSHANGGGGVHIYRTSNVTVANNTAYGNGTDTCINGYAVGDLSNIGGANNVWVNNVGQSVVTAANPSCGQYCGARNAPLVAGSAAGITDVNNTYVNNVTYGGLGVMLFNNDAQYFSCSNNQCNTNPLLVSPVTENFALQSNSPAIGHGQLEAYLPATAVDDGACADALTVCP